MISGLGLCFRVDIVAPKLAGTREHTVLELLITLPGISLCPQAAAFLPEVLLLPLSELLYEPPVWLSCVWL